MNYSAAVTLRESVPVLEVHGELDFRSMPEFEVALDELVTRPDPLVVIDLHGVRFCDSSGLHLIVSTHRDSAERGVRLALIDLSEQMRRLIQVTGLDRLLSIYPSFDAAVTT